jgi:tetratricopeptide (TPR) repeat protein
MGPRHLSLVCTVSFLALFSQAQAQVPVPRTTPVAGSVVAIKGGEEMRFLQDAGWKPVPIRQDLIDGDTLRTNTLGNLAILFADQTQIRVGRNSTLVVRDVAGGTSGTTQLDLQAGNIWARASRGGSGVDVKTPAAVAAIRGTDWSLSVEGARTSLVVLEGVVELRNPQGSVTVRQGEGAVATIGQAPTKFVLVNSNDREQMLFYLSLRDGFTSFPTTTLKPRAMRGEKARIQAIPPAARTAEDWLSLAEIAPYFDGRASTIEALAEARKRPLSASQQARADLVEAVLAGARLKWQEAAALFARAERGVDPKRRIIASYGRYVAQSLADPNTAYPEPKAPQNDPVATLARAYVVAFRQDLNAAAEVLREAEKRFPDDTSIAVTAAQVAFTLNRREEMRASLDRAKAIDPDDPAVIAADANIRGDLNGEVKTAVDELRRAAEIAPGDAGIWNAIGLFESDRDAPLASEAAFRRAIAEDPESPVAYANLAILLLDQSRVDEAGALIDKALGLDPGFSVGYVARGRYLLQKGEPEKALEAILAGSAANPALSQGLLMAAIAYYQNGNDELAQQALDNADRLDPNDPVVSVVQTAIAIDQYQADRAILNAREAIKRYRQRGGDFAGLAVNKQGGSYPADAYRFLGLDDWGRFYGDRTFDAFTGSSYFDQAASRRQGLFRDRPNFNAAEGASTDVASYNLMLQGLFFDPLAVSGRVKQLDLVRRPFLDTEIGGSAVFKDGKVGWEASGTVQGFTNLPLPTSFALSAGRTRTSAKDALDRDELDVGSFFIGSAPSASDRFLVFGQATKDRPGLASFDTPSLYFAGEQETASMQIGGGWSHSFADRNVLTGALYGYRGLDKRFTNQTSLELFPTPFILALESDQRTRVEGAVAAINHSVAFGDFTLRYGFEAQSGKTTRRGWGRQAAVNVETGESVIEPVSEAKSATFDTNKLYVDGFWRPSDRFEAQVGIQRNFVDIEGQPSEASVAPRAGFGFSPMEGQWLRAAYRRDTITPLSFTLSPITTVGLLPYSLPVAIDGRTDTLALRWDAEWSARFFTAVEYQRQTARDLEIPVPGLLDTANIDKARVDTVSATANLWLGHGVGVFGTVGMTSSDVKQADTLPGDVPLIAGRFARAGLTFVHPSRLKFTITENFYGDITGDLTGAKLDDYWTTDASITWETPDRTLLFGLTVVNLFDADYDLAPAIGGTGRTFAASIRARF